MRGCKATRLRGSICTPYACLFTGGGNFFGGTGQSFWRFRDGESSKPLVLSSGGRARCVFHVFGGYRPVQTTIKQGVWTGRYPPNPMFIVVWAGRYPPNHYKTRGLDKSQRVSFPCFSGVSKMALDRPQTDVLGNLFGGSRGGYTKGENRAAPASSKPLVL